MNRTLITLFAAVCLTVPAHASKPASKPCGCGGKPNAPAPSPAPSPAPTPAPTPTPSVPTAPTPSPVHSPSPAPAPTPSPGPAPSPAPSVGSPAPSQQAPATRSGMGSVSSGGTWKPWNDAQYQRTLEPREHRTSPDPVIAREEIVIPESTPQPSTVILYEPVEVIREVIVERIVEVPVIVEKTTNVCPIVERKKRSGGDKPKKSQVCK